VRASAGEALPTGSRSGPTVAARKRLPSQRVIDNREVAAAVKCELHLGRQRERSERMTE